MLSFELCHVSCYIKTILTVTWGVHGLGASLFSFPQFGGVWKTPHGGNSSRLKLSMIIIQLGRTSGHNIAVNL